MVLWQDFLNFIRWLNIASQRFCTPVMEIVHAEAKHPHLSFPRADSAPLYRVISLVQQKIQHKTCRRAPIREYWRKGRSGVSFCGATEAGIVPEMTRLEIPECVANVSFYNNFGCCQAALRLIGNSRAEISAETEETDVGSNRLVVTHELISSSSRAHNRVSNTSSNQPADDNVIWADN